MISNYIKMSLLTFILSYGSTTECFTYFNSNPKYSLKFNDRWCYINSGVLKIREDLLNSETTRKIHYMAGLQLKSNNGFQLPYILLQQYDRNDVSLKDMASALEYNKYKRALNQIFPTYQEMIDSASLSKPYIDTNNKIIYMAMSINNIEGNVICLSALVFGKEKVVAIHFYAHADFAKNYYNEFINISRSCDVKK